MEESKSTGTPKENQLDALQQAAMDKAGERTKSSTTNDAADRSITSDPETPSDAVNERDQEIQEEKIHDVSEENDTMHNPAMDIGKSYVVTTDDLKKQQANNDGDDDDAE